MVRVISVHHFASQHVQTVEQPTASTVAPPDRLLIALTSNCVEVRDLKSESDVLFTFPTVDEAIQIVHCKNGDFVATLETKFNRQNKEINFVRVYLNWDSIAALQQSKMTSSGYSLGSSECGMVQPMRARIAGRVTPTTNQSELGSLEMIEIPVRRNPNCIACCQVSGNLLLLSGNVVNIYGFKVKNHDISKLRFVDFEELPLTIELPFAPTQIEFAENYVSCMDRDSMYACRIVQGDNGKDVEEMDLMTFDDDETIDFEKLLRDERLNIGNARKKFSVNLPSVIKENSLINQNSPFVFCDKDMTARVHLENERLQNYQVEDLIQLKLVPILVESVQKQVNEEFKCMIMRPLYIDEKLNKSQKGFEGKILKSEHRNCLSSVVCFIATQQEGYLYYFSEADDDADDDKCIAAYSFTAPVQQIVMEDYFLHALTETGLESYTLRFGHKLCRCFEVVDDVNVTCPPISDSVCLVGLRPFLGIEHILLSENNLILFASSDTSPTHSVSSNSSSNASYWTLYNLELPTPKTVFNDISIVANVHRFSSAQTYCHLMSEAHIILRMALILKKWTNTDDNVKLVVPEKFNNDDVIDTYRTSCALLADHYIMCQTQCDYSLAVPYYRMAGISAPDVMKRVKKVQEQANVQFSKGLMHYLKTVLLEVKTSWQSDRLFTSTKENFSETILDVLKKHGHDDLPGIILKSGILREYSTDRLIAILQEKSETSESGERYLALALLYIQKCKPKKARECLDKISKENLQELLVENRELLFENTKNFQNTSKNISTFSELAVAISGLHPTMFAELLVTLIVTKRFISLKSVLKIFLEYLPSSIGSDGDSSNSVLQRTLELYFMQYLKRARCGEDLSKIVFDKGMNDAIKLLVRSYLSQLQIFQMKADSEKNEQMKTSLSKIEKEIMGEEDEKQDKPYFEDRNEPKEEPYLFSKYRHAYLNKMPPFQVEFTSKLYEVSLENYTPKEGHAPNEEADFVLKKLQALLISQLPSKQAVGEVTAFLQTHQNIRGALSLQIITMGTNDAVLLLIDECPQCLVQFGKDRFTKNDEWKFMIATIQRRILRLSHDEKLKRVCFFYKKILKDTLKYLATTMKLEHLIQVFPERISSSPESCEEDADEFSSESEILNEIQDYQPYIVICKEVKHANQIHKLIVTTSKQLLNTLHL